MGQLMLNSRPFSRVKVDGRFIGNTGFKKHEFSAGRHTVELTAEDGRSHSATVVIKGNDTVIYCWNFDLEAICKK